MGNARSAHAMQQLVPCSCGGATLEDRVSIFKHKFVLRETSKPRGTPKLCVHACIRVHIVYMCVYAFTSLSVYTYTRVSPPIYAPTLQIPKTHKTLKRRSCPETEKPTHCTRSAQCLLTCTWVNGSMQPFVRGGAFTLINADCPMDEGRTNAS